MDQITTALEPLKQFSKDSIRLIKRCTKPDRKEFSKIAIATAIGFGIMVRRGELRRCEEMRRNEKKEEKCGNE